MVLNTRTKLAVIILLAVVVRSAFCLAIFPAISGQPSAQGHDHFDNIARNLLHGAGYRFEPEGPPTTRRPPLYPVLLYLAYAALGIHPWAYQLVQVLLAGVTVWLIFLIGQALFSEAVGLLAAALFSLHPHLVQYTARPYTETLYLFLICLFAYLLLEIPGAAPRKSGLIAGGVYGLMLLTKGVAIWFPVLFFLGWLIIPAHRKLLAPLATYVAFFAIGASVIVSPWTYRNYVLTGKLIVSSTSEGGPLYHGFYVASHFGDGRRPRELHGAAVAELHRVIEERLGPIPGPIDEYHSDRLAYSLWLTKILDDPVRAVHLFVRNLLLVWFLTRTSFVTYLGLIVHLPLLGLSLVGLIWLARHDRRTLADTWVILSPILYFNVIYAVAFPFVRYILPVVPFIMLLASFGLLTILGQRIPLPSARRESDV